MSREALNGQKQLHLKVPLSKELRHLTGFRRFQADRNTAECLRSVGDAFGLLKGRDLIISYLDFNNLAKASSVLPDRTDMTRTTTLSIFFSQLLPIYTILKTREVKQTTWTR